MADDPRARLQRQAAKARAREADARAEAEGIAEAMRRLDRTIGAMNEAIAVLVETRGLTAAKPASHNRANMHDAPAVGTLQPRRGRPSESRHPFVVALAERGSSLTAWAEAHGLKYGRVKGWVSDENPRRIPREWAEKIEAELSVPALLASWPQGIR